MKTLTRRLKKVYDSFATRPEFQFYSTVVDARGRIAKLLHSAHNYGFMGLFEYLVNPYVTQAITDKTTSPPPPNLLYFFGPDFFREVRPYQGKPHKRVVQFIQLTKRLSEGNDWRTRYFGEDQALLDALLEAVDALVTETRRVEKGDAREQILIYAVPAAYLNWGANDFFQTSSCLWTNGGRQFANSSPGLLGLCLFADYPPGETSDNQLWPEKLPATFDYQSPSAHVTVASTYAEHYGAPDCMDNFIRFKRILGRALVVDANKGIVITNLYRVDWLTLSTAYLGREIASRLGWGSNSLNENQRIDVAAPRYRSRSVYLNPDIHCISQTQDRITHAGWRGGKLHFTRESC